MTPTKTSLEPLPKVTDFFILKLGLHSSASAHVFILLYLGIIKLSIPHHFMETVLANVTNNLLMVKFNKLSSLYSPPCFISVGHSSFLKTDTILSHVIILFIVPLWSLLSRSEALGTPRPVIAVHHAAINGAGLYYNQ